LVYLIAVLLGVVSLAVTIYVTNVGVNLGLRWEVSVWRVGHS
jgi:Flp pilus assembly pilin Flp